MITIISGTNRKDSRTLLVAKYYFKKFSDLGFDDVKLWSLEGIDGFGDDDVLKKIESDLLIPSDKFVFVMPEYNGSFPGILKLMLDQSNIKKCWWRKKALLVGVADGRGGNLRGIEHMTNILHYLKMNVYYNKLPLSRIKEEMNDEGVFLKEETIRAISEQINDFASY